MPMQISLATKDVFIECTATDLTKAHAVLNTVACMFAEYCSEPFEVEPVQVVDSFGEVHGECLSVCWKRGRGGEGLDSCTPFWGEGSAGGRARSARCMVICMRIGGGVGAAEGLGSTPACRGQGAARFC